ncbi:DUF4352 domain-containing protein [Nonomuraea sp. NPDC050328]|uniref:DUF4352 domain-containing protein n=1 Tax=Nonomuraea sp. NPDC050328 TaxID=3364361 RepID=UPI003793B0A5
MGYPHPPHDPYGQQPTGPHQPPGYPPQPAAHLPHYGPQPGTSPYGYQQPALPPPPPPPPRRSNLPLILILAIGLPLVLLGGCTALVFSVGDDAAIPARERIEPSAALTAGPAVTTGAQPPPVDQQAAPQTSRGEPEPEPADEQPSAVPVGRPLTLEGLDPALKVEVQVVKVFDPATPDNLFMKPSAGNRFVAVEVTLTNAGQAAYRDSPSIGSTLIDTEGRQYRSTFATVREAQGFGGLVSMTGTDTRRGALVFEVPDGVRLAKFQLGLDSGLAPQRGEWLLN